MKTYVAPIGLLAVTIMGCEVEIDPNAFFPQDYETSFTQVGDCRKSALHSDPYYLFHVNSTGKEAFTAKLPLPEGTVLLKTQYKDDACTDLDRWTVMKKREAGYDPMNGDWEWQNVDPEGKVAEQGKLSYCKNCHAGCPDKVCTM
jgi:hypothetical protein